MEEVRLETNYRVTGEGEEGGNNRAAEGNEDARGKKVMKQNQRKGC